MDIHVPKMADGVETATVVNILVKVGDRIEKNQDILELETAKAVGSVPSPAAGVVSAVHVQKGAEVAIGQVAISLAAEGEAAGAAAPKETVPREKKSVPAPQAPEEKPPAPAAAGPGEFQHSSKNNLPPPASPSVRKLAAELGIDLTRVRGSEHGGRITPGDVKAYVQWLQKKAAEPKPEPPKPAAPQAAAPVVVTVDFAKWGPVRKEKLSALRRAISEKMTESWTRIPQVTQFDSADVSALTDLRKKYADLYKGKGAHLTLTSFAVAALVRALKEFPVFNASLDEENQEIVFKEYFHVGIAVDTEQGLIVPVIRDADRKDLLAVTLEIQQIADKARRRTLTIEEMQGGTFTISNQGGLGGSYFTPIINRPEAAILGVGRASLKPVIRDGKVETRSILPLGLTYDHRIIDGAKAARFITRLVAELENFDENQVRLPLGDVPAAAAPASLFPVEPQAKPVKSKTKKGKS